MSKGKTDYKHRRLNDPCGHMEGKMGDWNSQGIQLHDVTDIVEPITDKNPGGSGQLAVDLMSFNRPQLFCLGNVANTRGNG